MNQLLNIIHLIIMINERSWAGHVISWIKEAINNGSTIFQEATNDEGIIVTGGKTRFPDILLFVDKTAGN